MIRRETTGSLPPEIQAVAPSGTRFPPEFRVRRKRDFDLIYREGGRTNGQLLALLGRANSLDHARLGLAVSRRAGNAVVRNWWKRRIRELFRRDPVLRAVAVDLVVSVKSGGGQPEFRLLEAEFARITSTISRRLARR